MYYKYLEADILVFVNSLLGKESAAALQKVSKLNPAEWKEDTISRTECKWYK